MHTVRGTTKILGVVGSPISHSLSPQIQNAAIDEIGLDWVYVPFSAPTEQAFAALIKLAKEFEFVGLNVTTPYKRAAYSVCAKVDDVARTIGNVNTLKVDAGKIYGFSTDGAGVAGALERQGGLPLAGASVVVLGTGATAKAALQALLSKGIFSITAVGRDKQRARDCFAGLEVAQTSTAALTYKEAEDAVTAADAVVDATSLGMREGDPSPIPASWLSSSQVVLDVTYGQKEPTRLIRDARAARAVALDGVPLLVEQGARSLEIWADLAEGEAPRETMMRVAKEALAESRQ